MQGGIWDATDVGSDFQSQTSNVGEIFDEGPTGPQNECNDHADCGHDYFCHSGWNGAMYGLRTCVEYKGNYCRDNPCGAGDGDCDPNQKDLTVKLVGVVVIVCVQQMILLNL